MKSDITVFEKYQIRRIYDEKKETWFFSVTALCKLSQYQIVQAPLALFKKQSQR
jgi:hypothetical protein